MVSRKCSGPALGILGLGEGEKGKERREIGLVILVHIPLHSPKSEEIGSRFDGNGKRIPSKIIGQCQDAGATTDAS